MSGNEGLDQRQMQAYMQKALINFSYVQNDEKSKAINSNNPVPLSFFLFFLGLLHASGNINDSYRVIQYAIDCLTSPEQIEYFNKELPRHINYYIGNLRQLCGFYDVEIIPGVSVLDVERALLAAYKKKLEQLAGQADSGPQAATAAPSGAKELRSEEDQRQSAFRPYVTPVSGKPVLDLNKIRLLMAENDARLEAFGLLINQLSSAAAATAAPPGPTPPPTSASQEGPPPLPARGRGDRDVPPSPPPQDDGLGLPPLPPLFGYQAHEPSPPPRRSPSPDRSKRPDSDPTPNRTPSDSSQARPSSDPSAKRPRRE